MQHGTLHQDVYKYGLLS